MKNLYALDWIRKYELFVIDLDNTLYDETLYLEAAYRRIGEWVGQNLNLDQSLIFNFLIHNFKKDGRGQLFNKMEQHFNIAPSYIDTYLTILRSVSFTSRLPILPPFHGLLRYLAAEGKHIAILTNGNPEQQKNKVRHIEWPIPEDQILFVYANEICPKPSPAGLEFIKSRFNYTEKVVFIGDSATDRETAINAKVDYIDIEDPSFGDVGDLMASF